ncbi:PEP-CTERM sorting domain-containing protein [Paraglaciecola sp. 25GB23A]|uniref:PEP-CTERM sorting domain-containing protein n=1 Tax=Paraglaciecola sp. 25GB23A TaxID=3156068 RepID=UPI0032AFEF57
MKFKFLKMAFAGLVLGVSSFANSALILLVDLTVENQLTISATSGLSLATVSGSDNVGFSLMDLLGSPGFIGTLVSGSLTSANQTSDGSPILSNFGGSNNLNVWSFTGDQFMTFTAGSLAFSGQVITNVDAATYANLLAGQISGDVLAPFDNLIVTDESQASLIGTWQRVVQDVPEPSTLAIFALGLMGLASRRFMKKS